MTEPKVTIKTEEDNSEKSEIKADNFKTESTKITVSTTTTQLEDNKTKDPEGNETEKSEDKEEEDSKPEIKCFECSLCNLREKYDYFGNNPPFSREYRLEEHAYIIEDPFLPPKRGEFLVLGSHCIKCGSGVCKDTQCSFYFGGTYCMKCAKENQKKFPGAVQEKLNRIVI